MISRSFGPSAVRFATLAPRVALVLLSMTALASSAVASSSTSPGRVGSIAFRRYFNDQHNWGAVFTVAADGTHTRQITHPARGTVDTSPDWSPDGNLIAFVKVDEGKPGSLQHLWTVHPDGTGLTPVGPVCPPGARETTCPDDTDPSFTPDSRQLTFVQSTGRVKTLASGETVEHSAIALVDVNGSARHVVYQAAPYSADLAAPMASPNGKQIVFERHNSSAGRPAGGSAVFVVGVDGSGLRRLTPWAEHDGDNPDWSPDGQWILFHSQFEDGSTVQGQYVLIHPDGTGRKQISHFGTGTFVGSASFSPGGRSIVFAKGPQGGNIDLFTMSLDGSHVRRITRSKLWDSAPDWGAAAAAPDRVPASSAFPSGAWRVTVTTHDLVSRRVTGSDITGNRGVWTFTFTGTTWVETQRETVAGPVTDTHHGTIALRGSRVCFTDTGERLSLGCYTWSRVGELLRYSKPTISGPLAQTDGPGILKALFTAHPWRRVSRGTTSAAGSATHPGLIAFTRYRFQDSPLWSEIWVARPDGSDAVKVSHSSRAVEDDQAHFSPDGRWIVFDRCSHDGPCSVWLVHPNGKGQVRVKVRCAEGTCDDSNASFAPDGHHLVIQHEWGTVKHGTIPDNDQIEHSSIIETTLDGSRAVVLRELGGWQGGFEAPRLTPNGKTLLFRSYVWHPGRTTPEALFVAPRGGGAAHRITPLKLRASGGEISPDGHRILFHSTYVSGELTPGNAMYVVGIDGRGLKRLLPSSASYFLTGGFSPDGSTVVFATDQGATGTFADVFTLNLATGSRVQVTHTRNLDGWPTWSP